MTSDYCRMRPSDLILESTILHWDNSLLQCFNTNSVDLNNHFLFYIIYILLALYLSFIMHIIITVLVCTYHPIFSNAICYMTPRLSNIIVRLLHVVPYHITPYHITSCSRHSTAPSTSSTSSRQGGLSAAVAQSTSSSSTMSLSPASSLTMQSVIQSRVNPSPLTHRRERDSTSTSACRTSSASQQHDRRDYDIQNATQIAASYRRGVLTDDALNSHTVSNSRTSITTPVSSGTGPGNQGQGGAGGDRKSVV